MLSFTRDVLITKRPATHPPPDRLYDHSFYITPFPLLSQNDPNNEKERPPNCYRYYAPLKDKIGCGHRSVVWNGYAKKTKAELKAEAIAAATGAPLLPPTKRRGRKRKNETSCNTSSEPTAPPAAVELQQASIPSPRFIKDKRRLRCLCKKINDCHSCGVCRSVPVIDLEKQTTDGPFTEKDCICEICLCQCQCEWTSGLELMHLRDEIKHIQEEEKKNKTDATKEILEQSHRAVQVFHQMVVEAPSNLQQEFQFAIPLAPPNAIRSELAEVVQERTFATMVPPSTGGSSFSSSSSNSADPFEELIGYMYDLKSLSKITLDEYDACLRLIQKEDKYLLRICRLFRSKDENVLLEHVRKYLQSCMN